MRQAGMNRGIFVAVNHRTLREQHNARRPKASLKRCSSERPEGAQTRHLGYAERLSCQALESAKTWAGAKWPLFPGLWRPWRNGSVPRG